MKLVNGYSVRFHLKEDTVASLLRLRMIYFVKFVCACRIDTLNIKSIFIKFPKVYSVQSEFTYRTTFSDGY